MNNRILINKDKDLFDKWSYLGSGIEDLRGVVQNDSELDIEEFFKWISTAHQLFKNFSVLVMETLEHVNKGLE